jgi:hypothetical protein
MEETTISVWPALASTSRFSIQEFSPGDESDSDNIREQAHWLPKYLAHRSLKVDHCNQARFCQG